MNAFGFTNSQADLDAVIAWRDAAVADGWDHKPTYSSEAEERAATLNREGYVAHILTRSRSHTGKWLAEAKVSVWGPDGLAIRVPTVYDWSQIKSAVEKCHYCGAQPVKTKRVGFAGRACITCAPIEEGKLPRGYYD